MIKVEAKIKTKKETQEPAKSQFGNIKLKFKNVIQKIKSQKIKKKHLIFAFPILLIISVISIGLILTFSRPKEHTKLSEELVYINSNKIKLSRSNEELNQIILTEVPQPKTKSNPINGNPITSEKYEELKNKKVFAVTINNHTKARPQFGLSQADMVMEVLTEGGITRYVSLFYENEPEKIGPVRSVRRYMLDFLAEFDSPVILHEGAASYNPSNTNYVRKTDAVRDLNEFSMKSMQSAGSRYRDLERAKTNEYVHSLFTGYALIESEFEFFNKNYGWERESDFETTEAFKFEDSIDQRGNGGKLDIKFLNGSENWSRSGFDYNKETNSYDRTIVGEEDIDALNNLRVSPKNVVVEWHDYADANDGYARIIVEMIGEGPVSIYRDGKVIEGYWKKDNREARTRYYDNENKEIELNRGQIWKVIAIKSGSINYSEVNYEENN